MLVDIFSTFDDHNFVFMSAYLLLWGMTLIILILFNMTYWVMPNSWSFFLNTPKSIISSQVIRSFGKNLGGFRNILAAIFLFLIFSNLLGLVPYIFSPTSHLAVTFSLALPLWFSLILSSATYSLSSTAASLLPGGAPALLNPFLILVETVSITARPMTLSIRLAANMSAGHIIIGLMGTYVAASLFTYPWWVTLILILLQIGYFMFEFGVALIQGYVFSLLLSLYSNDHATY